MTEADDLRKQLLEARVALNHLLWAESGNTGYTVEGAVRLARKVMEKPCPSKAALTTIDQEKGG